MKKIFKTIFNKLADCIVPTLPLLVGAGMLKVLVIVLGPSVLNLISETNSTFMVLSFVANAGYYFMPIYIAFAAGRVFKTNEYIAALIGAMLIAPEFVELINAGTKLTIFGLPIASTSYGNQVLPSVIAVFIESLIFNFLDEHFYEKLKPIFVPVITIVLMIPIAFCLIGPLGVYMGNLLAKLIMLLKDIGPIGNGILTALIPYTVILGLGGANLSCMLTLAATGEDPILFFSNVTYNVVLGFVVFAIYLKDKKADTLAMAIASAVGGVSDPAIFGIAIKDTKVFAATSAGGFVGGILAGIFGVKSYAMASFGIFGIIVTIGGTSPIVNSFIALIAGSFTGFIISYLIHSKTTN